MKAATVDTDYHYTKQAISIHAAREGGDLANLFNSGRHGISIHAAREGGDVQSAYNYHILPISIHAAREGGDHLQSFLLQ